MRKNGLTIANKEICDLSNSWIFEIKLISLLPQVETLSFKANNLQFVTTREKQIARGLKCVDSGYRDII